MGRVQGLNAVVTGAAGGIGFAVAERLVDEGAEVWLFDNEAKSLHEAVSHLGGRAHAVEVDIRSLGKLVDAFDEIPGDLDVVVANAGIQLIGLDAPVGDVSAEVWNHTMDVNLTGTFYTLKCSIQRMLQQAVAADGTRGSIVVTGSPTGVTGAGAGFVAYSASKAGIHGLARTTAMDYAASGIRVNVVIPGHTLTPLVAPLRADSEAAAGIDAQIPLGRPATVNDCVGAYLFLASNESCYVTGSMLYVDGGMTNL